jgi:hypothetical protein
VPGLLVAKKIGIHRKELVVIGLDGSTKATVWRPSQEIVNFDCDPASRQIVATLLSAGFPYDYTVVLLTADGAVRQVEHRVVQDWDAVPSPLLLADGSVVWEREKIRKGWPVFSAWYSTSGSTPRRVRISGDLPGGFQLDKLLPLAGRRSVALVDVLHSKTVILSDWSSGHLTVRGRPYLNGSLSSLATGGPLPEPDSLLLESWRTNGAVLEVSWRNGFPTARIVLAELPSEPSSGDTQPMVGSGPLGWGFLFGWWHDEKVGGRRLGAWPTRAPLMSLNLSSGKVTQTRVLLRPSDGLDRWQWVQ